jgi:hypothetical protein
MEMSGEHLHQLLDLKEISPKPIEREAGWTPGLLNLNILLQSCVASQWGYVLKNASLGDFVFVRTSQSVRTKT